MSKYTTGELAKLCGVTVRTVQYYDSRNLLVPSELSEGGRRLYSEEDLRKMKIICFLRNIGLPIGSIAGLLKEKDPQGVITLLLDQQAKVLHTEIEERQEKLAAIGILAKELKNVSDFSVESIGDIAYKMENQRKLYKMRALMVAVGIPMDIIEVSTLVLWIVKGIWWPFVLGMSLVTGIGVRVALYYYRRVAYICPECHTVFRPGFWEMFFARHTPNLRKLTCRLCGHRGFCIEAYHGTAQGKRS